MALLNMQGQRLTNIVALNRANTASLRVQGQWIRQHCNARVPSLSTTGSSVASALMHLAGLMHRRGAERYQHGA